MAQDRQYLIDKANSLPLTPGVYIMRNEDGKVIYVGKSRALKNRVSQYFRPGTRHNVKTAMMVSNVRDFDYILTDTEHECLALENQLIKQYDPKYNIKLKDGKHLPYVRVDLDEEFPKVTVSYSRKNDGAKYFGPYSPASAAYDLVKTVQKCFKVHSCNRVFPRDTGKERPCLYYQIGDCVGPCTGEISSEEYKEVNKQIVAFLRGSFTEAKRMLSEKMDELSEKLMFEAAAVYRDRIEALSKVWQRHKIVSSPDSDFDIFALYSDDALLCLDVFYIREGRIISSEDFIFTADELLDESDFSAFLFDFYTKNGSVPKEVLLSFELGEGKETLEEFLSEQAGRRVTIHTPERGEKKKLCDMALENAERHAIQYKESREKDDTTMIKLAAALSLEVVPQRIESYDISNYGADSITAGMVVTVDGKFKKSEYRVFKIKTVEGKNDDYASMEETLRRRVERARNGDAGFLQLPDLILLDGGKGHVGVIRRLFEEMGVDIPVYGMVKDDYHKTRTLCDDESEISIAREKSVYLFLYKLQEEVHRFTISRMREAKGKTFKRSSLTELPGIGDEKAKRLLAHFKGLKGIREASVEELTSVQGIGRKDAENIYDYFNKEKK